MYQYFVDLLLYMYLNLILIFKAPSIDKCLLPAQIQNGNWTVLDNIHASPGQNVSYYAKVAINCIDGFQAYPAPILTCGELRQLQPQCLEILSPIPSTVTETIPPVRRKAIETTLAGCTLPEQQIENGNWTVIDDVNARPGQNVASDTKVQITCIDGFKAYPAASLTCHDLIQQPPPQCLKTCPSIATTFGTSVTCKFQGRNTSCEEPYHGSTAFINCIKHYENRNNDRKAFTCRFGAWNFEPKYECEPVCGQKFTQAGEYIINGKDAEYNEFTWQVALYEQKGFYEQICGGTILTPKITLSAGHCFKKPNNPELYFIGAGKTFRNYLDPRDTTAQYSNISNLIIPEFFSTNVDSRYDGDIAILVLTTPFEMNEFVMPACLDKNIFFKDDELLKSQGTVVGWGFTEANGSPSERLKYLDVDYKTNTTCVLKTDFKRYYFPHVRDKICAGILNEDTSACKGDSGGGLVFKAEDDRFYVRGIVSIGPQEKGSCDASQYTLYTSVSYHLNFILEQIAEYNIIDSIAKARKILTFENGCILPGIVDGKFDQSKTAVTIYDGAMKPGFPVPPGVEITVTCNSGFRYYPEGASPTLTCNRTWSGEVQCKRYCGAIRHTNGVVQCDYNGRNVSCEKPYTGSVALIACQDLYRPHSKDVNPIRFCEDGFWSAITFPCYTTCGLKFIDDQTIITNDSKTSIAEFPWNVVIYKTNTTEYLCTGTLIELDYVLTPSHCVEGLASKDVYVVAGQSILSDSFEPQVQIRTANRIIFGPKRQIPIDTVILRLNGDFLMTKYVQSICVHYGLFPLMDKHGFVTKWVENDRGFKRLRKVEVVVRENHMCNITDNDDMKICVEILGDDPTVCFDPTGAVIAFQDDYTGSYFIKGIANMEQEMNNCTSHYRTFTYARFDSGKNDWRNTKITN